MSDTAICILHYKNHDHFRRCFAAVRDLGCDLYVCENPAAITLADEMRAAVAEGLVKKYALFGENIANGALTAFLQDGHVDYAAYRYVILTDGDLEPDAGWLDECKAALEKHPDLFVIALSLYLDNLPLATFPEAATWIPANPIDRGDYWETITGCHFMTFRASELSSLMEALAAHGDRITDARIHDYAAQRGMHSGKTKIAHARHLTWDYFGDPDHPYTRERTANIPPWYERTTCAYEVIS